MNRNHNEHNYQIIKQGYLQADINGDVVFANDDWYELNFLNRPEGKKIGDHLCTGLRQEIIPDASRAETLPSKTGLFTVSIQGNACKFFSKPLVRDDKITGYEFFLTPYRQKSVNHNPVLDIIGEKAVGAENNLEIILNNTPSMMLLVDSNAEVHFLNNVILEKFSLNMEECLGDCFGNVIQCVGTFNNPNGCGNGNSCKTCTFRNILNDTFEKKKTFKKIETDLIAVNPAGETELYTFLLSSSLINIWDRQFALLILDDISERKRLEIDLILAKEKAEENDRLKTAFLANLSHEIRTPMNGIIGFSEMLARNEITHEKRKFYSDVIINSSRQLLGIVNDVLEIARLETGQVETLLEPVSVSELMRYIQGTYQPKCQVKKLAFECRTHNNTGDFVLVSDRQKLHQILSYLIDNAIKFTHRGEVRLEIESHNENQIVFKVYDTGIGIPENMREKIFERFCQADSGATREFGGTGLGLTIARNLAELLHGTISLESELHKGSVFSLTIPLKHYNPKAGAPIDLGDAINEDNQEVVILIAEDEDVNYLYLEEVLDEFDVRLIRAKTGVEIVEQCKEYAGFTALILMDVKMPVMNGFEATRRIKGLYPDIPVIAQTAYAMSEDKDKALEAGCDDYLTKPVDEKKLLPLVKKYIKLKRSVKST